MRRYAQMTVIAVLAATALACATPAPVKTHTVLSDDGVAELVAPESWYTRPNLGRSASLRLADAPRDAYLLVNSYFPDEIDPMSLDEFAQRVSAMLQETMSNGRLSEPRRLTVNDRPAVEYEIAGAVGDTRIVYLSTAVEGQWAKYHIVAWTSAERYRANRDAMRSLAATFRESATRRAASPRIDLDFKWPKRSTANVAFHSKRDKRGEVSEMRLQAVTTVKPSGKDELVVSSRVTNRKMTSNTKDEKKADFMQKLLKEAMTDLPDYVVTEDGDFVRIDNLGAYQQRIEAAIMQGLKDAPPAGRDKARQMIQQLLSEQMLATMIEDEWNNLVGNWSGGSYVPGRNYEFLLSYQAPALGNQEFPMTVSQQLKGYTPCHARAAAKSCVRLVQTSHVAGADFTRATDRMVRATVGGGVKVDSVEVVKTVEIVTDPKTLMPHQAMSREVKTITVTAEGKSQTSKETEESTAVYRYAK
jgi:hypothetical protein